MDQVNIKPDDIIEGTYAQGDLRMKLTREEELSIFDPRDNDNLGVMVCSHRSYRIGDRVNSTVEHALLETYAQGGEQAVIKRLRAEQDATVVLPLYLLDHSGLAMRAGRSFADVDPGQWDSGLVGFIFDTAETRELTGVGPEHVEQALRAEVNEYDQWLQGDVWAYVIERRQCCDLGHEHWEHVDSCGGFIGWDWARQAATDAWNDQTVKV